MELGLCIFILSAIIYFYSGYHKNLRPGSKGNVMLNGIETQATVLFIEFEKNGWKARLPKIQIQVEPVHGRNFVTEIMDISERVIHSLEIGDKLLVKYLAKNPKAVVFVKLLDRK